MDSIEREVPGKLLAKLSHRHLCLVVWQTCLSTLIFGMDQVAIRAVLVGHGYIRPIIRIGPEIESLDEIAAYRDRRVHSRWTKWPIGDNRYVVRRAKERTEQYPVKIDEFRFLTYEQLFLRCRMLGAPLPGKSEHARTANWGWGLLPRPANSPTS